MHITFTVTLTGWILEVCTDRASSISTSLRRSPGIAPIHYGIFERLIKVIFVFLRFSESPAQSAWNTGTLVGHTSQSATPGKLCGELHLRARVENAFPECQR